MKRGTCCTQPPCRRAAVGLQAVATAAALLLTSCRPAAEAPVATAPAEASLSAQAGSEAPSSTASEPSAGAPWFRDEAQARGLDFQLRSGARAERPLFPETMVGGGALFDMDQDGDLDAYLVQAGSLWDDAPPEERAPGNRLFRNEGGGRFTDVTAGSGAEGPAGVYGVGAAAGDYDNDGDVDLYVTAIGRNSLLANQGGGRFADVTEAAGVGAEGWPASAAWLDFDRDGDLDLYVARYLVWSVQTDRQCFTRGGQPDYCGPRSYAQPLRDLLYRNEGDGRFSEISEAAGLGAVFGNGMGVSPGDFDDDGWPDVFVANDGMPNQLWMNQRDGTFRDEAPARGVAVDEEGLAKAGMGNQTVDIDDDGDLDLWVVNLNGERDSLFINEGDYFRSDAARWGLAEHSPAFTRFGTAFQDLDNDGWLDLYLANGRVTKHKQEPVAADPLAEGNLLFRGSSERRFSLVAPLGGTAESLVATSRAAIFGDVDEDGLLDILVVNRDSPANLLHNVGESKGHWLRIRALERHGRDAYGARLRIEAGGRRLTREIQAAYSYVASNDPRLHIGLGAVDRVDRILVRWPTGEREVFAAVDGVDRQVTLRQGEGEAQP